MSHPQARKRSSRPSCRVLPIRTGKTSTSCMASRRSSNILSPCLRPPGSKARAIRKHFAKFAAAPLKLQVRDVVVRQTTDPEVIVAEWDYHGLVTTTGRMFRVSNIQVSRVRHGKIVESRDYHNHALMADVMGRLPVLVAALD